MMPYQRCRLFENAHNVCLINVDGTNNHCQYLAVLGALRRLGHDLNMSHLDLRAEVRRILQQDLTSSGNSTYLHQFHGFAQDEEMRLQTQARQLQAAARKSKFQRIPRTPKVYNYNEFLSEYLTGISGTAMGDMLTLQVMADKYNLNIRVYIANMTNDRVSQEVVQGRAIHPEASSHTPRRTIAIFLMCRHYQIVEARRPALTATSGPSFADIVAVSHKNYSFI